MAEHYFRRAYDAGVWPMAACTGCDWIDRTGSPEAFHRHLEEVTERENLTRLVDDIISGNSELAHAREDALHLDLITKYAPDWVVAEITRLTAAEFPRWGE